MLGKRVKEIRLGKNWSLKELSIKSGISIKYLKIIEEGKAVGITTDHLFAICKSFGLSSFNDLLNFFIKLTLHQINDYKPICIAYNFRGGYEDDFNKH